MVTPRPSLASPSMSPVWQAIRDRLQSQGFDNRGRVRTPVLPAEARHTVAALIGRQPTTWLDLAELERALVDLDVGANLPAALANLGYGPSSEAAERRSARRERRQAQEAARSTVSQWPEPWAPEWIDEVIRAGLLSGFDPPGAVSLVESMRRVLDRLDASVAGMTISRTDLAATILGSAHALDRGTVLEAVLARALSHRADANADQAWERAGIHTDQVSGAVLTWALPVLAGTGLHPVVAAATDAGVPVHLTRYALALHPVRVEAGTTVLVAENPRVVEAAAQRSHPRATITTNGNPSAAVRLLLDQLLASSAVLLYHGDFDAPGLAICARLHQIGLHPWKMDAASYRAAVDAAHSEGVELPPETRPVGPTPWDPSLQRAVHEVGRIVHEERLLDDLLRCDVRSG